MIHWLTASSYEGSELMLTMLEAIMAAVTDPLRSGLRELGARSLGRFVKWSLKHKPAAGGRGEGRRERGESPLSIRSLLLRLYGLAAHRCPLRRLAFAATLNSPDVYRQLREDDDTSNLHCLELLQVRRWGVR